MASTTFMAKDPARHHLVYAIFIAGFATVERHEKDLARRLLGDIENVGICWNVVQTRKLLEMVVLEQFARTQMGLPSEEVDWIILAKDRGIEFINPGL